MRILILFYVNQKIVLCVQVLVPVVCFALSEPAPVHNYLFTSIVYVVEDEDPSVLQVIQVSLPLWGPSFFGLGGMDLTLFPH